ncbi:MAG: response regulator [Candidatus Marinarcus sp.]|uniref:response regulator n=1 Tax=Candidatus Marinarcus sp. TaxID=3100987 RepID=UPI003B002306
METSKIKSDLRNISLLIAEDGQDIINILDRTFKMLVKEIHLASDGAIALSQYNEHNPDVIITDLRMPNLDGAQLIKEIRRTNTNVPIIVVTAFKDDLSLEEQNSVSAVFEKPINFIKLVNTLDECIQGLVR